MNSTEQLHESQLSLICESTVPNVDTVSVWRHSFTKEYVVTYGERKESYVDEDDALEQYVDWLLGAIQCGKSSR